MPENFIITPQDLNEPYVWGDFVWATTTEGLHAGTDWIARWKNLLGGRVKSYDKKVDRAITAGTEKIKKTAQSLGCNAIIGLRINVEAIPVRGDALITVNVYGTAVKRLKSAPVSFPDKEQQSNWPIPETMPVATCGRPIQPQKKAPRVKLPIGSEHNRY
jgi:uncharacterized protein YbjQ (UPF0145 family)